MSIEDELRELRSSVWKWAERCDGITPTKIQGQVCNLNAVNDKGEPEGGGPGVGDSVLLSAILCHSGEAWACESVKRSQGLDGKMWRAPQRVERGVEPIFSRDHLLGVLLWMVTMKNNGREDEAIALADKWWNWIAEKRLQEIQKAINEITNIGLLRDLVTSPLRTLDIILGGSIPSRYRICDGGDDYCSISLIPYGHWGRLMLEVWRYIGATISIPKSVEIPFSIPGLGSPSIPLNFDLGEYSVCDYNTIFQQNDFANSLDEGFHDHLNIATALILRAMGRSNSVAEQYVQAIASRNPNPFFLWAAGKIPEAMEEARRLCPKAQPKNEGEIAMTQWAWERAYSEEAWKESFGWDFVAVINLLLEDLTDIPHLDGIAFHADSHTDLSPRIDFHGDSPLTLEVKAHLDSPAVPAMSVHADSPVIPEVKAHLDSPAIPAVTAHLDSPAIPAVQAHSDTPVIPAVRAHGDIPVIPAVRTHADTPVIPGVRSHIDTPRVGHGDMHGDTGHGDLHGDRWRFRVHTDTPGGGPHTDVRGVVHGDAHTDTPSAGHIDAHTDTPSVGHVDAHTDTPDVGHIDAHTDTPDVGHIDAHTDTPDVGHIDAHTDTPSVGHIDAHTDTPPVGHIDTHTDIPSVGHIDAHTDVAQHADAHSDAPPAHLDVP